MTTRPESPRLVVPEDSRLYERLRSLARTGRRVFFAGLPGTGKSLLIHQLAHLAQAGGRTVHLIQWDVTRPILEASPAGLRYPVIDGVSHGVIRKAAGLWVRRAVRDWERHHPEPEHLLLGETPLVGHRFIELAQARDDTAEPLLAAAPTRFVIPVPSREVRQVLEAERARRAAQPVHPREREDAPPPVLRDLWRELAGAARALGLVPAAPASADPALSYDPELYRRVYERLLRHRPVDIMRVDVRLPTATLSVYDFAIAPRDVVPTPEEADAAIQDVERRYRDPAALRAEIDHWYRV